MKNKLMENQFSVSVIVPARNEAGTIADLVKRVPKMGKWTEIIFVEGFSNDGTWEEIQKQSGVRAYKQKSKKGKAGAVWIGFKKAKGDILMILDSDLSVPPEDLTKFYDLMEGGKATFVNGSRFVYSQEKGAMRYFNHLGNKFFAFCFSFILKQNVTDTLCGTKAIFRKDYKTLAKKYKYIFKNDPYGDFSLLLGAGKMGLKVLEVPIKYKARVYGKSKISPFFDGLKLIKILLLKNKSRNK